MPEQPSSLSVAGARQLARTSKSAPMMRGSSPRWLLRMLPWVASKAGTMQINRRRCYDVAVDSLAVTWSGSHYLIPPASLHAVPLLRGFDEAALAALADAFVEQAVTAGQTIIELGTEMDALLVLAHGRADKLVPGDAGELVLTRRCGEGDVFGDELLLHQDQAWAEGLVARSDCVLLRLDRATLWSLLEQVEGLGDHIAGQHAGCQLPQDRYNQPMIDMLVAHAGEVALPTSYVEYELEPRIYELAVAQTILRVHTRVSDLYNDPYNQLEQQLRLTIECLRERQEHELVNNPEFGLLHNVAYDQRVFATPGPPTPDDLDELLTRRRSTDLLLAHPRVIGAFARECTRRGVNTELAEVEGRTVVAWRGVPLLACDKLPISSTRQSSILALRLGLDHGGVIGLHQPGIPDEVEPSLNVRFMGIDATAVSSYLLSVYFSAAVLVDDALGILDGVAVPA